MFLRIFGYPLYFLGGGLKGRGRHNIFIKKNIDEIVRLYDGQDNPIGKSFSKTDFIKILKPYFIIEESYCHFFPARALPFKIPKVIHRFLDKYFGFMIYFTLRKK